ncbi:hypothetical protein FACS1894216_12400 [Synergistales bacterium]|nr:hypothetical protein FACS1894216_12400 [Synergistales bacterium]
MLNALISFIEQRDGINNKTTLSEMVREHFNCVKDRPVFYTRDFAIRFCKANSPTLSNTVLSLSALQKYDDKPFVVCISAPRKNYMLLANSTFLSKISHSSKELRIDNIKGSFNGSDIIRQIDEMANAPENFEVMFGIHQNITFEENLVRLVDATNGIVPTGKRFDVSIGERLENILDAPSRAIAFATSPDYQDLLADLNERTGKYENEILVAACIDNVNLRGRIIEYIIAGDDVEMRRQIIENLINHADSPRLITRDGLGDYSKRYPDYYTETDIKTKIMVLASAPKGYNLDKMLEFLAEDNTVFMIYLVGIDYERKTIKTKLISMFQETLVNNTVIQTHWAGRNSRGVSQFNGEAVKRIILNEDNTINADKARKFLDKILNIG